MVFSSIIFLLYFLPFFLLTYFLVGKKYKNIVLLVGSIIFYSWGAPKFIFVILLTTFIDFHLMRWMDNSNNQRDRKLILVFSIVVNLGLLFYFKYSNFFIDNINSVLSFFSNNQIHWIKLILPIGISFYTFETITYVVDVYRKIHKPLTKFWDYQLYIILFPKLIAGPIIRYHELADQIEERKDLMDDKLTGFYRFIFGLAKKVLIANQIGLVADAIFNKEITELSTSLAWVGSIAYTFQIYFDFSGYSDMAIGLGKMLGFKFPENFNNPYTSQSVTEFWRRWHITLGNWMRNYLYIPLGGNKVSKFKMYFNLWIVFLASGFWHGASWSFIFWGAYHGLFLILEKLFLSKFLLKIGKIPSIMFTFFIINMGWVFFRKENLSDAMMFLKAMFVFQGTERFYFDLEFSFYLFIATFFSFFSLSKFGKNIQDKIIFSCYSNRLHLIVSSSCVVLLLVSIASITTAEFNPFIYFRF